VSALRLSGITRSEKALLRPRNRIYERVFDISWIEANFPDAEKRRQREAFRRGVWRSAAISSIILLVIGTLAVLAVWQRNRALEQASVNHRLLYLAQMKLANQELENANVARVQELVEATRPRIAEEDLRGFEWYYFWKSAHSEVFRLAEPN